MRVVARIDHGAGAAEADLRLRPTELLLAGHPRGGTPLTQDRQTAGIDLPPAGAGVGGRRGAGMGDHERRGLDRRSARPREGSAAAVAGISAGLARIGGRAAAS